MVIDTSVFIEHLRAKDKSKTKLYSIRDHTPKFTTSVTIYELLVGAGTIVHSEDIKLVLSDIDVLPFDKQTAIKAAEIFRDLKKGNQLIEFRDIFIAAICITNSLPIVTLNKKHFSRIEGLSITVAT
ncbi:type II toxin-antitoxin system VapC family toxin [uncultured Mucilaginibacter sp.]|uniref:type II toxin-antitoxin system VapC family toxin n=1 Tax=uncultured Mucilaginibacter sp. TaxID=797541 RepID=UPI0025DA0110|nr:type II toxin-antitoxin system VapC family toxin [uncultured Mucilaginibacter sp.]